MTDVLTVIQQGCIKHFQNKVLIRVNVLLMSWSLLALVAMGIEVLRSKMNGTCRIRVVGFALVVRLPSVCYNHERNALVSVGCV